MIRLFKIAEKLREAAQPLKGKNRKAILDLLDTLDSTLNEVNRDVFRNGQELLGVAGSLHKRLYGRRPEDNPKRNARIRELKATKGWSDERIALELNLSLPQVRSVLRPKNPSSIVRKVFPKKKRTDHE